MRNERWSTPNKANVDRLEQLQAFERITAPFDGVITARNTDIGALIQAGDNSAPKEIFHLASIRKLRVYIPVPGGLRRLTSTMGRRSRSPSMHFPMRSSPGP